jgi:hypothetical protein
VDIKLPAGRMVAVLTEKRQTHCGKPLPGTASSYNALPVCNDAGLLDIKLPSDDDDGALHLAGDHVGHASSVKLAKRKHDRPSSRLRQAHQRKAEIRQNTDGPGIHLI